VVRPEYVCARPGCERPATTIWLLPDWWFTRAVAVTCGPHRPRNRWDGHKSAGFPIPLRRWLYGDAQELLAQVRSAWVLGLVREALARSLTIRESDESEPGPTRPRRRASRSPTPEHVCDRCWKPARLITVLPGLREPRVARITCWEHEADGDSLELRDWSDERRHWRDTEAHGAEAVELVERALARAQWERQG
jgi:hypothetical protein